MGSWPLQELRLAKAEAEHIRADVAAFLAQARQQDKASRA